MPKNEHLVLCGRVGRPDTSGNHVELNLHGPSANVHLKIADISKRLVTNIPDALIDLLEIASYVYAADSAISRGGRSDAQMGQRWRRDLRFVIPVRRPQLWSSTPIKSVLEETLSFLSDDQYVIEFKPLIRRPVLESYFEFPNAEAASFVPDDVILFSGGLDSCAGAISLLTKLERKIALVSHRSSTKISGVQVQLAGRLRNRFGASRVLHIPVWTTLDSDIGRESTHRVRSFLFTALGAVTAHLVGKNRISFFENGVVSLNLPPVAQVVGSRATRTTHPQALAGFRRLLVR